MNHPVFGTLYLVATPIGNLGDISERAARTLREVDFIAAEDTRVTRKLLEHLNIKKPLVSYYEHNQRESGDRIIDRLIFGESCALVTDAGTPGISDPGEGLVRICADAGIPMIAIPGPCAAITALAMSGLPAGRFTFEGFLSTSKKSRFEHLGELKNEKRTMVFYEAPHKLLKTLNDMLSEFGDRRISVMREITKIYEETLRLTISEAIRYFEQTPPRGEFVLVIAGAPDSPVIDSVSEDAVRMADSFIREGASLKDAVKKTAAATGASRNALYNAVLKECINDLN